MRALASGRIVEWGCVVVPAAVGVGRGERLLVVRGSGRALGFIVRGPIYEEALKHPELMSFDAGAPEPASVAP